MADKKTFTIEIDGLKEAYKNVVKLRDAIKELDDIELNVDSDITIISNTIEQNLSGLAQANVSVQQSFTELSTTINENTAAKEENTKKDKANIGSITELKENLKKLKEEYENLSKTERNALKGSELAVKIKKTEKEIEAIDRRIITHLDTLGRVGTIFDLLGQKITNTKGYIGTLSDTLSNASKVMKTFGVDNETLNNAVTNLSKATELFNSLQALHTSLVAKDSLVMKGASLVQKVYAATVASSSVAMGVFASALAATGIGAIIILIGLLVANFDKIIDVVTKTITSLGGLRGIIDSLKIEFERISKIITQKLIEPFIMLKTAIEGVKKAFDVFKNSDGFFDGIKNAWSSVKDTILEVKDVTEQTTKNIEAINAEAAKQHLENQAKIKERFIKDQEQKLGAEWKYSKDGQKAHQEMFDAKLKLYKKDSKEYKDILNTKSNYEKMAAVQDAAVYIKEQEEKNGANWKFTEEGIKKYQEYFSLQLLMYEKDSAEYKRIQEDKAAFDAALKKITSGNSGCGGSGGKSKKEKKEELEKEVREYNDLIGDIKNQTQAYENEAIEQGLELKRKQIEIASNKEISEARKLEIEKLKKDLAEKLAAQKKASDEEIKGIKDKKEALAKAAQAEEALRQAKLEGEKQIAQVEIDIINEVINTRKQAVADLEEVHKTELNLLDEKNKQELAAIDKKYEEDKEKYKGQTQRLEAIHKAYEEQKTAITKKHVAIRAALEQEQEAETEEATNKVDESELDKLFKELDADKNLLEAKQKVTELLDKDKVKRNKLGLIDVGATKENYKKAIEADKEYLAELEKIQDKKLEALDQRIVDAEGDLEKQKELIAERIELLKNYEKQRTEIQTRIKTNEKNEAEAQLSFYEDLHNKTKEKWDKINTIMTTVGAALTSALKGQLEELKEKQEEITKQYEEAVEKHKQSQEKLKALEEEAKTATGGRAMVVQEQIARQMEANSELAKQEKDLAKQKEKLEKDAAKKEKQMKKVELAQNLVTGIANTALGITEALKKGPILGPIMAAMIGAMGAVQTATIAKQIAKLEDGGLLRGKRHAQGGMRIEGTNIEVEGDEYVVNRVSTNKNLGLINYINQNRKELTASDINSYFARSGQNKEQRNLNISGRRMYEQGGMLTNLETVNTINTPQNDKILEALAQINFKPVVSVVDITSAQDKLSEIKDIAGA